MHFNRKTRGKADSVNQAKVSVSGQSMSMKARKVPKVECVDCSIDRAGMESFNDRHRRGSTVVPLANPSPESQLPTSSEAPLHNKETLVLDTNINTGINNGVPPEQLISSKTSMDQSHQLVKESSAQLVSSCDTLKVVGDLVGVSSQVSSQTTDDKNLMETQQSPMAPPIDDIQGTPLDTPSTSEQKPELSFWKRIKKMSSTVKIISAWKTIDGKLEKNITTRKTQTRSKVVNGEGAYQCISPQWKSSNTIPNLIDQLPIENSSAVVLNESISTMAPMSAKNDPIELPPLTPRCLTDTLDNNHTIEDDDDPMTYTDSSEIISSPDNPDSDRTRLDLEETDGLMRATQDGDQSNGLELADELEKLSNDLSPPNPPPLTQLETSSVQCGPRMHEHQDSSSFPSAFESHMSPTSPDHKSIKCHSISSESPDLDFTPQISKPNNMRTHGVMHLPNISSIENNYDCIGMQSGRSQLRRVDSARIGAQCELLRDTIKEESRRVMSMTSLLEALYSGPKNSTKKKIMELAQTREINKRQAEKIHDLEMENQHLRQLLEFSIGSIRRQTWMPGHAPDEPPPQQQQHYRQTFNNPTPRLKQADTDLVNRNAFKNKQSSKHRKGKTSKAEKERIDRLQQNLESKNTLLAVITDSIRQISSMHGYYQQRLEDLERDRSSIQEERSEHLNELLSFGIDLRAEDIDAQKQRA
eukprot:g4258.t1